MLEWGLVWGSEVGCASQRTPGGCIVDVIWVQCHPRYSTFSPLGSTSPHLILRTMNSISPSFTQYVWAGCQTIYCTGKESHRARPYRCIRSIARFASGASAALPSWGACPKTAHGTGLFLTYFSGSLHRYWTRRTLFRTTIKPFTGPRLGRALCRTYREVDGLLQS